MSIDPGSFVLGYWAGVLTLGIPLVIVLWATIERVLIPGIMRALRAALVRLYVR